MSAGRAPQQPEPAQSPSPPAPPSFPCAFDAHHPPSPAIIDTCVHCGFCLQACPTYLLWGQEMDSPRGRIQLIKMASEGETPMTPRWVKHFDTCLGCMACMTACPSGVDYSKLIESTRAQIERLHERSFSEKLHRRFLFATFTKPRTLRLLRPLLAAYQASGMQRLIRGTGALNMSPRLRALDELAPQLKKSDAVLEVTPATGGVRRRVGLLLGCVQREFLAHINAATVRVLTAEGCEVVAPRQQSCCGALLVHAGEEESALQLARNTIDVFDLNTLDAIVINAAGCGSSMKEYGYLLRDDPRYAERARAFSAKCKDVAEFLGELGPRAVRQPLPIRVAYQDACHLQHAQGIRMQPRALLAEIPGLQLMEIPEATICCGSAGIYNLVQPETARELGDRKAQRIAADADVVATGNPGCLLQLASALARSGRQMRVVHTIELLDAAIRGAGPDSFLFPKS